LIRNAEPIGAASGLRARSRRNWDVEFMKQYWFGVHCESQWTAGSSWEMVHPDGRIPDAGEIVEAEPPKRLLIRCQHQAKPELKAEGASLCTMEIERSGSAVKLSITHTIEREPSKLTGAVSGGWPKVISNLNSLLETGSAVMTDAYPVESSWKGGTGTKGDFYIGISKGMSLMRASSHGLQYRFGWKLSRTTCRK
jgi:uncharacterized protein YndB with AHSA1/START domain